MLLNHRLSGLGVLFVTALTLTFFGCENTLVPEASRIGDIEGTEGAMSLSKGLHAPLADLEVTAVRINVVRVDVHREGTGWTTTADYAPNGKAFDLLDLAGDLSAVGIDTLDGGVAYTQIRLLVDDQNAIAVNEGGVINEYPLTVPGGAETGIKMIGPFILDRGGVPYITLDFEAARAVTVTGKGDYVLKPTIAIDQVNTFLFKDNFEDYTAGSYPSAGGWYNLWSGAGHTYVVSGIAHEGGQSFRLTGHSGWVRSDGVQLDITGIDELTYEVSVMVPTNSSAAARAGGFFKRKTSYSSTEFNTVILHPNGLIYASGAAGANTGVSWTRGTWYRVKVALDYSLGTMDVWIDGEKVVTGLAAVAKEESNIFCLATVYRYGGIVYFDDVKIY